MSWPKKKNHHFELSSSLILCNNNEPFLNQIVTCDEKWILYDNQWRPAQWLDWEEALKHFSKLNFHQKMVMMIVWWSAACLIHYSFLNPSKTMTSEKHAQQINEMHQKLVILKHHILLFYTTTMNHFSIELWPAMKSGFYMTTGDDQLSGGTEKLQSTSQSQTCCQSDPLQLSESQQNHYIWEVCSANHWDALKTATHAVGIGQQKGANSSPWQRLATHHTSNAS